MAYNLEAMEISIWLVAQIKQFSGEPLPTSQLKIVLLLVKYLKAFWFCFITNGMVIKGCARAGHFWRTVLQGRASSPVKFWALSVREQGVFLSAAASTWHFCSSFYKKSVSIEQDCLGDTEQQNYWAGSVFLDGTEQAQQRVPGKFVFKSNDE